jgi:hypothetical protein
MRKALRRGLFLSLLLALALPLASCDSGGSNSSPDWVGNWEVNGTTNRTFFDLDQDQFTTIEDLSSGCDITNQDVLEQDGDVVTVDLPDQSGTSKFNLDVSDGTLTLTVVESDNPNVSSGDEATAASVDGDPREIAGCS